MNVWKKLETLLVQIKNVKEKLPEWERKQPALDAEKQTLNSELNLGVRKTSKSRRSDIRKRLAAITAEKEEARKRVEQLNKEISSHEEEVKLLPKDIYLEKPGQPG